MVRPVRQDGREHRIAVVEAHDEGGEAAFVALEAERLMADPAVRTLGCLFRTNMQAEALEAACRRVGIPHRVVGGLGFFARKEIRDALAFLRVLENPWDAMALKRIINVPPRGIGPATIDGFFTLVEEVVFAARRGDEGGSSSGGSGSKKGQKAAGRARPPSALTCLFSFLPDEELEAGLGAVLRVHGPRLAKLRVRLPACRFFGAGVVWDVYVMWRVPQPLD